MAARRRELMEDVRRGLSGEGGDRVLVVTCDQGLP